MSCTSHRWVYITPLLILVCSHREHRYLAFPCFTSSMGFRSAWDIAFDVVGCGLGCCTVACSLGSPAMSHIQSSRDLMSCIKFLCCPVMFSMSPLSFNSFLCCFNNFQSNFICDHMLVILSSSGSSASSSSSSYWGLSSPNASYTLHFTYLFPLCLFHSFVDIIMSFTFVL